MSSCAGSETGGQLEPAAAALPDANVVIHIIEGYPAFESVLRQLLLAMDAGRIVAVTSELTLAETLVKPLALGRQDLVAAYQQFVAPGAGRDVVPISREILQEAARIRATSSVKLPDAIHLASAVASQCGKYVSNDVALLSNSVVPAATLATLRLE